MIKVGKLGTEPLLEALDSIVGDWVDGGLILSDESVIVVDLRTGDGVVEIVLSE